MGKISDFFVLFPCVSHVYPVLNVNMQQLHKINISL